MRGLILSAADRAALSAANLSVGVMDVSPKLCHGNELRGQRVLVPLSPEAALDLGVKQVMIWWDDFRSWCAKNHIDAPVSSSQAFDCNETIAAYAAS